VSQIISDPTKASLGAASLARLTELGFSAEWILDGNGPMLQRPAPTLGGRQEDPSELIATTSTAASNATLPASTNLVRFQRIARILAPLASPTTAIREDEFARFEEELAQRVATLLRSKAS
jgi:hypothetical protein